MREITLLVSDKYAETLGDALMDADVLSVVDDHGDRSGVFDVRSMIIR